MSAFGRANDMPPMLRNKRSGNSRRRNNKTPQPSSFMLQSDSEQEYALAVYETSDVEASKRAVESARNYQQRVRNAIDKDVVDKSSEDDSDSSEEDGDEECNVPDEPSSNMRNRNRKPAPSHRSGGHQFQVPLGGIPISMGRPDKTVDISNRIRPPSPRSNKSYNGGGDNLPQVRTVQIRKSVKRMHREHDNKKHCGSSSSGDRGVSDIDDLILDENTDRRALTACINDYLRSMRENPYYRYAIEVAVTSGHSSYPTYYISSQAKEILKILDPTSDGDRRRYQQTEKRNMRQLAETLRSAAYMLKNHCESDGTDNYGYNDGMHMTKRQRVITSQDISTYSSNSLVARDAANRLVNTVLTDMESIHNEHRRLRALIRQSHPSVHKQIYLDDKLTPFIDQAMNELYERGANERITAHVLIVGDSRLRSLFAQLTAYVINAKKLASGGRPALQAEFIAVGSEKERYANDIIDYIRRHNITQYNPSSLLSRGSESSHSTMRDRFVTGAPIPQRRSSSLAALLTSRR
jgi:hypothetical protein